MADIVNFPPTTPPEKTASPEHEQLRQSWRLAADAVRIIAGILDDTSRAADLTDDQRWELQWQAECLLDAARASDFVGLRLPPAEYHRRRDRYMRSIGLGHLT